MGNSGDTTNLTYQQLRSRLIHRGYREHHAENTPGTDAAVTRVSFVHSKTGHIISLDRPPGREYLTRYQVTQVLAELDRQDRWKN
ncbi:MAG: type II toxin-antitoxin system HicA family toxin [Alkalispirochaeta sp.]